MINLEIRDIILTRKRDLVIDVALVHDVLGNSRDAHRNGQLCYDDLNLLSNNAARAKVQKYRDDYSASHVNKAFLPALVSTSGRIRGEFLRLLYSSPTARQSTFSKPSGRSPPVKPSPGAAPNTSFITARPSGSHELTPLPSARTWLLTLPGASPFPLLARCIIPSSLLTLLAVPKPESPPCVKS